jgi:hypothetical protein
MKNKLGEEKEKNCSPITKERDVGEENNLHWFPKKIKKLKKKNGKKNASMKKRKDSWRERGKKCVYPF